MVDQPFTPMTGVNNMVKALMDGQSDYQDGQKRMAQMQAMRGMGQLRVADINSVMGAPSMQTPPQMSPQMPGLGQIPTSQVPMTGSPQMAPGVIGANQGLPGMPNGIDPTVSALFSKIPGQGGQFGG